VISALRYNYPVPAGNAMNHLNRKPLLALASVLAVVSNGASGQMSGQMMRESTNPQRADMNSRDLMVTEDHWISSIVDRWTSPQRKSWQMLDARFRSWAAHLVWVRKTIGHLSDASDLQASHFQVPAACPVAIIASPGHSVAESMGYFREVMPDVNWQAWNNIEPKFREMAEWEMSVAHARAQLSKAEKNWWELNGEKLQSCLYSGEPTNTRTASATLGVAAGPASLPQPNARDAQIDRRAKAELRTLDHMIAPEPVKQEAREQISDAAAVDKFIADVDRRKP
jgi:hypothetical protein